MKLRLYLILITLSYFSFSQNSEYKKFVDEGLILLEKGSPELAIDKYSKAFAIDSNRVEALYGLGVSNYFLCMKDRNICSKAIRYLDKAALIDSTYRQLHYNRGACKALMNNFDGALNDFNFAIELDKKNGYYYYNRAFIKMALGDKSGACSDVKQSVALGYNDAKAKISNLCN